MPQRSSMINQHTTAMQSAYGRHYYYRTVVTCVLFDMIMTAGNGNVADLVILDPSVAFENVDHYILLYRLFVSHCIVGRSAEWSVIYLRTLHARSQHHTV